MFHLDYFKICDYEFGSQNRDVCRFSIRKDETIRMTVIFIKNSPIFHFKPNSQIRCDCSWSNKVVIVLAKIT